MLVKDDALLQQFREARRCEWCGRAVSVAEPAHIFAKGMGGGGRLDIPCNLVALGSAFDCACHRRQHDGHEPLPHDLLALVAARYGVLQLDVENEIHRVRRLAKGSQYQCPFTGRVAPLKRRRA